MHKVSIIVPVYKVENYLSQCLDSILEQTFTDWECILVDDGSPDHSGAICDEYAQKDARFRVIHKENGGVSSSRNVGLDVAQGYYIYFIDSDDYVENDALELSLFKAKQTNADIVVHGIVNDYLYNHSSTAIEYDSLPENDYSTILEMADRWNLLNGPVNKLFINSIIKNNELRFDESISYGEDTKFTFEYLTQCNTIAFVPKHLYHYCFRNEGSLTSKSYPFDYWIKTASMLRDVRLPIASRFNIQQTYYNYISRIYVLHVSKAIKSLYIFKVSFSDRMSRMARELQHYGKDYHYLNRMVFLLKYPLMLDFAVRMARKFNKRLF